MQENWGQATSFAQFAPTMTNNPEAQSWWARLLRQSLTRNSIADVLREVSRTDVRHLLSRIAAPTLILHREGDRIVRKEIAQFLADSIPSATLEMLPGEDHLLCYADTDAALDCAESFFATDGRPD